MRGQTLGAGESLLVQVDSGILTEYVFEEVIPNLDLLVAIDVGDCVFDNCQWCPTSNAIGSRWTHSAFVLVL